MLRQERTLHVNRFGLLRFLDFRRLIMGQFASQVADAMATLIVVKTLLFGVDDGPTTTQLVELVATIGAPLLIAGPLGGAIADRFARHSILVVGQLARSAYVGGIGLALTIDAPFALYGLWGLGLCVSRLLFTARGASIRHLVRRHELVAADSLALTLGGVAGVIGAGLGVVVMSTSTVGAALLAASLHLVSTGMFWRIRTSLGGGRLHRRATWEEALSHLRSPKSRYAIVATSVLRLLNGVVFSTILLLASDRSSATPLSYATAMGAIGLGTFVGNNTAEWINERIARRALTTTIFALTAIVTGTSAVVDRAIVYAVALGLSAFFFQNLRICSDATIQSNAIHGAGGRVFALYDASFNVAYLVGILVGLGISPALGEHAMLFVAAGLLVVASLVFMVARRVDVPATGSDGSSAVTSTEWRAEADPAPIKGTVERATH